MVYSCLALCVYVICFDLRVVYCFVVVFWRVSMCVNLTSVPLTDGVHHAAGLSVETAAGGGAGGGRDYALCQQAAPSEYPAAPCW